MRVAWFSPLPPAASGIADYSAELIEEIGQEVDLQLVVPEPASVAATIRERFAVLSVDAFGRAGGDRSVDLCLYQVGNNADFHAFMMDPLQRWPGVVVLHEFMLHHLVQGMTLARGDAAGYVEAMRYAYGALGADSARRLIDHGLPVDIWSFPLFEKVVDVSRGLIVHSDFVRKRVLRSRPSARIVRIAHHLSLGDLDVDGDDQSAAFRASVGLADDDFVVGVFGLVTPHKRLDVTVSAFKRLRRDHPRARLLIAGEISPFLDTSEVLEEADRSGIVVTGRLPIASLLQAMSACDVAVNLRHPTGGETSGTLMRLLGIGRPVVVSDTGAFAEIPNGCCIHLPLDAREGDLLVAYLDRLARDAQLRRALGENARRYMRAEHDLPTSARAYVEALQQFATETREPFVPAPPLLPVPDGDLRTRLLGELGLAAADLGADERDRDLMTSLVESASELGLASNVSS